MPMKTPESGKSRIVIIDDEQGIRFSLRGILEDDGHEVFEAETGEQGLELIESLSPEVIFLDIWLPGLDGLAILERLKTSGDDRPVIMISGHGNIETAVSAIKKGAFDFIEKPLSLEKVLIATDKALELTRLRQENLVLRSSVPPEQHYALSGSSPTVQAINSLMSQVAPTDTWVLITGENGTGKEIVARALHQQSNRCSKPMIAVNCAAIPEELIESELFGHEKGSFTGAESSRIGKFEMAHGGTLFLDEIGDMSLKTQAKILRILQEHCFERVGGRRTITVDVRVIAATNKDLSEAIREGAFREDLYYRLKVFPLHVPPLRERIADLWPLINEFLANFAAEHGKKPFTLSPEAFDLLAGYPWPGNVRELKNFVERMMILYAGMTVGPEQLPPEFSESGTRPGVYMDMAGSRDFKTARAGFEARFLTEKLKECSGNVAQLAESIGLERSYLYRKLKTYGIATGE